MVATNTCLTEDELLELGSGGLAETPEAEAHLAECSTCSALLASVAPSPGRPWDELAGTTIGPYRVDAQIGAGAMGSVYRGWDPKLSRAIALKVMHRGVAALDEARAAAAIDHRAIVAIYDVGVVGDLAYVAMELVEGETLRSTLKRGAAGGARARDLMRELAEGLDAAHTRGVVHRDLKPENLVVARDGLRILDFGLATTPGATGAVGTPGYMAPEQVRGESADARSDLFAAGAIGYELATGRRAFPGADASERLAAVVRHTPPLDDLGALAPILARCLAKEPRDRFQSAADLAWALRAANVPPARPSRRALVIGAASAIAAGALGFVLGRRHRATSALALRFLSRRIGRVYTARFTPDGSRIVYGAAWDSEPVRVFQLDLTSGETMPFDVPSADVLAVSRQDLALSLDRSYVDHECARGRLAIMRLAGGELRPVAEDVQEADFTAPSIVASVRPNGSGFRIELPTGTPFVESAGWISDLRVSPDRTLLAYAEHPQTDDEGGEIVVVDIATKARRTISRDWVSIAGLAWEPRGDALVFGGSRTGWSTTLHRLTLDGDATTLPSPSVDRVRVHDVSDRGTLVTLDQRSQRVIVGERDVTLSAAAYAVDISADGSQVVVGEYGGPAYGTYLVPYAGGRVLRLGRGFPAAISPSGELVAANIGRPERLVAYSTRSGETFPIAAPDSVIRARWLDERTLLAAIKSSLWRLSLDAAPVKLADTGGRLALDPARRRCAYVDYVGALHVYEPATNTTRIIARGLTQHSVAGWLATPDAIVVRWTGVPIRLDQFDPVTGERTPFREIAPPRLGLKAIDNFVMHADGARFAYSFGHELGVLALATTS